MPYLLVFLTGDKQAKPKLGIDLQGGTRVTLTARTPDGSAPTREALDQAQQIISARVNGLGVSGSEVIIDGNNLVITVPGQRQQRGPQPGPDGAAVHPAGDPRRCRPQGQQPPTEASAGCATGRASRPAPGAPPGLPHRIAPARAGALPSHRPASRRRAAPHRAPAPQPPPVSAGAAADAGATAHAEPRTAPGAPAPRAHAAAEPPNPEDLPLAQRIADEKQLRQSADQQIQILALQFQATRCDEDDVLAGNDDPNLPLVTCSQDGKQVYLLDKSIISGEQIENATLGPRSAARRIRRRPCSSRATPPSIWADFTAANVGTQTAFVLDSKVVSAPEIQEAIPGGRTQITGQFTQDSARELANVLKYGSLPLSFESSEAETVSATLGLTSLRAGLIAGAIGVGAGAGLLAAVLPGARSC